MKTIILLITISAAMLGFGTLLGKDQNTDDNLANWYIGSASAKVKLIEYSDFQCPACAAYYPVVKKLLAEFGDQIGFEYRHFPLKQHPYGELAARATEAAGQQGKFWQMHDWLFENQPTWSVSNNVTADFEGYARSLSLDLEKFRRDLNSKSVKDKVTRDRRSGLALAVNATPTFLVNGVKIQNPRNYEAFKQIIELALKKQ